MKFGVVVFPGSNCDADVKHVIGEVMGQPVDFIWHQSTSLQGYDCIVLPGGFSYGDYLRTGAIARFSPVMQAVEGFAKRGGLVLGICNGFQILLEAGLLPGAMQPNHVLQFRCMETYLKVENNQTPFTNACAPGQVIKVPIAHGAGNYYADPATLAALEDGQQIVFRYCDRDGEVTPAANPNGSLGNIAGIINREGNVLGMMPHPERCAEEILGGIDGRLIFSSILKAWSGCGGCACGKSCGCREERSVKS
ncbi:MAG: phosphoribosylformylglycinamidine synthase subunit PurQ [Bacillota bacterium]